MSKVYVFNHYGESDAQALIDRPIPVPGPGEMTIEVRAAGVNPADWMLRSGKVGHRRDLPEPMGEEVSGVITALGEGVQGFVVGDAILGSVAPGHGGFAEHTSVRAAAVVAKPDEISFANAATIPVAGATAYDGTHQVELERGQTLLIIGIGGGVGLMAAQIGKVHGFKVIGTASESKREVVESTGAALVPYGEGVAERIAEVSPDGVDLILDLVGGPALRELAGLVTDRSRIISAADASTAIDLGGLALERTADALTKMTEVIEYGLVDPHVTARYPLDRADEAIAAVETGHATGKIVIILRVWRQTNKTDQGSMVTYCVEDVSPDMSFLEMLDVLNERLALGGDDPIAFDSDCREGICGACGLVINGVAHGPSSMTTTCQLHMRSFDDGDVIDVEPWRAKPFPVLKDLVVDRSAFDRIIQAGGFISARTGSVPDANAMLIQK